MSDNQTAKFGRRRIAHCWAEGPDDEDGCGTTCMLMDGHHGAHEWSRDDEITLSFASAEGSQDAN
jgi:hypothetical protein